MRISCTPRIFPVLLAVTLLVGCLAAMPARAADDTAQFMRQQLEQLHFGEQKQIGAEPIYTAGLLLDLYRKNQFQLLWTSKDTVNQLRGAIIASAEEGLIPDDYHLQAINRIDKEITPSASPSSLVEYDIILSDALLLLGQHKRYGKVDPAARGINQIVEHWLTWQDDYERTARTENAWNAHNLERMRAVL